MKPSIEGYRKAKSSSTCPSQIPPPAVGGASSLAPPTSSGACFQDDDTSPYRISSKDRMVRLHKGKKF